MIATQANLRAAVGELIVGYVEALAGVTTCDLEVPQGYIYELLSVKGRHNDNAASKFCGFQLLDFIGGVVSFGTRSTAYTESLSLFDHDQTVNPLTYPYSGNWEGPFFLTYGSTIRFTVTAIGGAKQAFIDYVVRRFRGIEYLG